MPAPCTCASSTRLAKRCCTVTCNQPPQSASQSHGPLPRSDRPRCRMPVSLVLACRTSGLNTVCTFVLGHALSMKAIQGGKATNDKIDAENRCAAARRWAPAGPLSLQGGARPATCCVGACPWPDNAVHSWPCSTYQQPVSPPSHRQKDRLQTNRDGVAERFAAPAVPEHRGGSCAPPPMSCCVTRSPASKRPSPMTPARYLRQTVPGIGKLSASCCSTQSIRSTVARGRKLRRLLPSGQVRQESAGKRSGTSGPKLGHAPLRGFLRSRHLLIPPGYSKQKFLTRLENKYSQGKALPILALKTSQSIVC